MRQFATIGAFLQHLAAVRRALPDAETAGLEIGAALIEKEAKDLIGTEYPGWPELAASTLERKEALGQTGRISAEDPLFATGELRATIGHQVEGHSAVIGTPDPVGIYHEEGTDRMPPRPFLAPAAVRKGEAAANAIGLEVALAIAGKPPSRR